MEHKATNVLILSAGAVAQDMASLFGQIPSGMVPINSKPAISWIMDSLLEQGFERFFVTTGFKKEILEQFLRHAYEARAKVQCVEVDYRMPPGNAILQALPRIQSADLLVVLGDTIVKGDIVLDGSFVYVSSQFVDPTKWCLVEADPQGRIKELFDKQDLEDVKGLSALIGVYYFKDTVLLQDVTGELDRAQRIQISVLLDCYRTKDPIRAIEERGWIDIGHLDKYHEAKILLARPREFNRLEHDGVRGVIKKQSAHAQKLRDEIQWYQHLPDDLKVLAPRMLEGRIDHDPYITLEYYGYPTLAELMVYGAIHPAIWKQIIEKLVNIARLFLAHTGKVSEEDYRVMYVQKTKDRLAQLARADPEFAELLSREDVYVNGRMLKNVGSLMPFVEQMAEVLEKEGGRYNCFLHGDFCFSNILFDTASGVVRLIDPRGRWGSTPYGDIRYDLAKLRHSVAGKYDHVMNDLFTVKRDGNRIDLAIHARKNDKEIEQCLDMLLAKEWNLDQIKFVEGLLFLSMIPLHRERKERQLAMFATGLTRLNEVYDSRK